MMLTGTYFFIKKILLIKSSIIIDSQVKYSEKQKTIENEDDFQTSFMILDYSALSMRHHNCAV